MFKLLFPYESVRILEQWGALLENVERILEHLVSLFEHLSPILEDQQIY